MLPNQDTCYLLGLILGGAELSDNTFSINLPFNKWGNNPDTAAQISRDLLTRIRPIFKKIYNLDVDYFIVGGGNWVLRSMKPVSKDQITLIKSDLESLGLPTTGQLIVQADLQKVREVLVGVKAELFLSGIFDARASIAVSHRRFTNEAPIVSIEIPGRGNNFRLVVQLCSWLTSLGSITDQILYNHPNQHSSKNPEYGSWRKGFKIRILVKSFLDKHSFAMRSFSLGASELATNQKILNQKPCNKREIEAPGVKVIHKDIHSIDLPNEVRDKVFLHYFHICAAMGCPFAPVEEVKSLVRESKKYISYYPSLLKGEYREVQESFVKIIKSNFPQKEPVVNTLTLEKIIAKYDGDGYGSLKLALAYLVDDKLKGKRTSGKADSIIEKHIQFKLEVNEVDSSSFAPLLIANRSLKRAAIVSSATGSSNQMALKKHIKIEGIDIYVK
jgi:hypothetical protein